ncbi:MAG: MFS transporter [Sphaerospermopsis sp. SIO1G2]|nr:MFS transporter [Sphaerospermopsis sp. SIO1G1]NET74299.1 MFS transporter [Sphaerospermopsis sp. SIO1G2]
MKNLHNLPPELKRNLLNLFAAGLLFWLSLSSLLPTLPLYIESLGATKQQIGIVMGSFAVGMLIFRSQLGVLADNRGRKIVLLIGMISLAIAPIGYLLVTSLSLLPLLMVIRAFHGISLAAFGTGFVALVADLAPEQRRGEMIGFMSLINPIGVAIGPALGGYLQASIGNTALFTTSSLLAGLGVLCLLPVVNPPILEQPPKQEGSGFLQTLISSRVFIPAVILLTIGLTLGTVHAFIGLYIKETGVNLNAGLFFTAAAIASFSVRLFAGHASDKYGRGLFITLSLFAYTISMIMIWQAQSELMFLLGGILEGAGSGAAIPMMSTIMTDRAWPHERGRIFGIALTGFDVGIFIAGPIFGAIAEQIGYRGMFIVNIALTFTAIVIFATFSGKTVSKSFRFAFGFGEDAYALKQQELKSLNG